MKLIKDLGTERDPKDKQMKRQALFLCEYCNETVKRYYFHGIKNKSCGCAKGKLTGEGHITHGDTKNRGALRLYRIWHGMKARCNHPKEKDAKHYKDKGIKVCKQWLKSYIVFKIWALMHGYKDNLTIDRKENDKGYNPENCRWITIAENERNRSNVKMNWLSVRLIRALYECDYSKKELFEIFDVSYKNLCSILNNRTWKESEVI